MSVDTYLVTDCYIKRKTGQDKYGKPVYSVVGPFKGKVEEEMRKVVTKTGEEKISFAVVYLKDELQIDDLISYDGTNWYPVLNVGAVRNARGEIVFYKGWVEVGNIRG